MLIRCFDCHADPAGRWVQPPASVFVDRYQASGTLRANPVYACRAHLSAKREEENSDAGAGARILGAMMSAEPVSATPPT